MLSDKFNDQHNNNNITYCKNIIVSENFENFVYF